MRNALLSLVAFYAAATTAAAAAASSSFSPFLAPLMQETFPDTDGANNTSPADDLRRRQDGCAGGYGNCFQLGAPQLCCRPESVCSADRAGNIGCCPIGSACTGTIGEPQVTGVPPVSGVSSALPTSLTGFVFPSTTVVFGQGTSVGSFVISPATATGAASRVRGVVWLRSLFYGRRDFC